MEIYINMRYYRVYPSIIRDLETQSLAGITGNAIEQVSRVHASISGNFEMLALSGHLATGFADG